MDQNKKNKLEACSDSFSKYAKGHTDISNDVTHSTRNFSAYLINIKYYSVRDYFHYWCCYVNPFMVIFMVMLRLAHFNFLHNIYTFPVQPINSLYFLPTDLIYDSVSIGIAFFLFVSVASLPVWYNILAFLMRTTARQLSTCPEILD